MSPPRYQELLDQQIPRVALPDEAGSARVIAGQWNNVTGPARTVTPLCVFGLRLKAGANITAPAPDSHTTMLLVQDGQVTIGDQQLAAGELALFTRSNRDVRLQCDSEAMVLMLTGEPIDEPVVGQGPFVMNTREEIHQAIRDYQSGRMGRLPA
jgi:redox-sensitive bicupin YhaK (pirin superfamily)